MDWTAIVDGWTQIRSVANDWFTHEFATFASVTQLGAIALSYGLAHWAAGPSRRLIDRLGDAAPLRPHRTVLMPVLGALADTVLPLIWLLLQWGAVYAFSALGDEAPLLTVTTSLIAAWAVIRLVSHLVRNRAFARLVAVVAWTIAALNIVGLYDDARAFLSSLSVDLGAIRVTALSVIESLIGFIILLWIATFLARLIDQQVRASRDLTPSIKVLINKLTRFSLVTAAVLIALAGAGIDLTVLTVFGGALGIGVGFGLQRIIANFVSGIILLLDKSVKPGDNIVVGDTFGWIDRLNARYVSVITRDGTEHLIPNEELITQRVENWSYSNNNLRVRIPIGVSYKSDPHKVIALCLEAARECERVLKRPEPRCLLRGFGDSSVDLELRIWIDDPQNGRGNIQSECLLAVWDKFKQHGIEIPFPQRDVHIRSVAAPLDIAARRTS